MKPKTPCEQLTEHIVIFAHNHRHHLFILFIYLLLLGTEAALPMRPGGEQRPKKDHTYINQLYTAKRYNKWLVKISMFSDSMMVTGKLFQSLIVFGKKEF